MLRNVSFFLLFLIILAGLIFTSNSIAGDTSRILSSFEIRATAAEDKSQPAVNTVNGSGMVGDLCDNRWERMWVTSASCNGGGDTNPNPGTVKGTTWIKFEFDKIYTLKEMWVWNYNEAASRGLKNVTIEYTADSNKWEKLGDYVFVQAPGTVNYAHNITVDFNNVAAKAVVITANGGPDVGNYGDGGMYGLSEVRFYVAQDPNEKKAAPKSIAPPAKLRLKLDRGITIDRQLLSLPPQPRAAIGADEIAQIKSMEFEFVKLLINPAIFKTKSDINLSNIWYFDQLINFAVNEKLPVVVCIHPEADFKINHLGNKEQFEEFLGFYENLAAYMAKRWNPDQLAFQFMTEPFGGSSNPDDWNSWDALQHRIWQVVRRQMPEHTLILSGDLAGQIEGVYNIKPVNDENVMYSFTFYEPHLFAFQNGPWQPDGIPYLKNLPYPSSPEILKLMPEFLGPVPEQFKAGLKAEIERYANESWNRERLKARMERLMDWNRYYGDGKLKIWCAEFGCFQGMRSESGQVGVNPEDRRRYINDLRTIFEENNFGWAYWSYNETFSVMTDDRTAYFGPASAQTPDSVILSALMPDKYKYEPQKKQEPITTNDSNGIK